MSVLPSPRFHTPLVADQQILWRTWTTANTLSERLEMCGLDAEARIARVVRERVADCLAELGRRQVVAVRRCRR